MNNRVQFMIKETVVEIRPSFWLNLLPLLAGLGWLAGRRQPRRSWLIRLLVAAVTAPLAVLSDVGHGLGHVASARAAGAPMETLLLAAGMPRTFYPEQLVVSSRAHGLRAIGGPLFNLGGLLFSLLWRRQTRPDSLAREAADVACLANGVLFAGSLAPAPIIDGGSLLKWTLVDRGYPVPAADRFVHQLSSGIGAALFGLAALSLLLGQKLLAVLLAVGGAIGLAAGQRLLE